MARSGYKDPALVGIVTSIQAAGGVAFGFVFPKLTRLFNDRLIYFAYILLAVSLTILSVFQTSLVLMSIGIFLTGASMSLIGPHCVVAVSHCVDARTSALATSLILGLAPGLGSFLSPVIFTNLTTAIAGESTTFRYQFVSFITLACGIIMAIYTANRQKRKQSAQDRLKATSAD